MHLVDLGQAADFNEEAARFPNDMLGVDHALRALLTGLGLVELSTGLGFIN
jgi:hypothetical protein